MGYESKQEYWYMIFNAWSMPYFIRSFSGFCYFSRFFCRIILRQRVELDDGNLYSGVPVGGGGGRGELGRSVGREFSGWEGTMFFRVLNLTHREQVPKLWRMERSWRAAPGRREREREAPGGGWGGKEAPENPGPATQSDPAFPSENGLFFHTQQQIMKQIPFVNRLRLLRATPPSWNVTTLLLWSPPSLSSSANPFLHFSYPFPPSLPPSISFSLFPSLSAVS